MHTAMYHKETQSNNTLLMFGSKWWQRYKTPSAKKSVSQMPILLISMILSQWHALEIRARGEIPCNGEVYKYSIALQACILTRLLFICMIIDKGGLVMMTCHLRINILL